MQNFKPQKKISVNSFFDNTHKHFESYENVKITFQDPQNVQLISNDDYLKTILRNLIGNAIKALAKTNNPNIKWKAW